MCSICHVGGAELTPADLHIYARSCEVLRESPASVWLRSTSGEARLAERGTNGAAHPSRVLGSGGEGEIQTPQQNNTNPSHPCAGISTERFLSANLFHPSPLYPTWLKCVFAQPQVCLGCIMCEWLTMNGGWKMEFSVRDSVANISTHGGFVETVVMEGGVPWQPK